MAGLAARSTSCWILTEGRCSPLSTGPACLPHQEGVRYGTTGSQTALD
jgi:hypothetical protein